MSLPTEMKAIQNKSDGANMTYSVETLPVPAVEGEKDLIVKIECSPINPSDLGVIGMANQMSGGGGANRAEAGAGLVASGTGVLTPLPAPGALPAGFAMQCGNEGSGIVVAAGAHADAQALMGKRVAIIGGQCYAQFAKTTVDADMFAALPDGITAVQGASVFVNPLTVVGFIDTMRSEGHSAIVHTAAGSQLGRMLVKYCKTEDVPLVNIVRSAAAAEELTALGAEHVVNSSLDTYKADLLAACTATKATLGFDATGGGTLAAEIIAAMEGALKANGEVPHPAYGCATHKQVYRYGGLARGDTLLPMSIGMAWGVGGWLMPFHFNKRGAEHRTASIAKAVAGLTTTFASSYGKNLALEEMCATPEAYLATLQSKTGEKFLICPNGPVPSEAEAEPVAA